MGRKNKLLRFAQITSFPNVYEIDPADDAFITNAEGISADLKGVWAERHFKNDHPVILELGCGKGDYTVALAESNSAKNFIGIDIKGARMWLGAKIALQKELANVAFLRTRIEFIEKFFGPEEVSEIWITFPDPFEGKVTRRLTAPPFLDRYRKFLKPGGFLHLKTDSDLLYEFTLKVIQSDPRCNLIYANHDIYKSPLKFDELEHKTYYELKHLAEQRTIKYLRFTIH